jgi:hypothetical protein
LYNFDETYVQLLANFGSRGAALVLHSYDLIFLTNACETQKILLAPKPYNCFTEQFKLGHFHQIVDPRTCPLEAQAGRSTLAHTIS